MKFLSLLSALLALHLTAQAAPTDFESYGYLNSPRDIFTPIDGYTYSPVATILDVAPSSSLYGWLAPAHSGRYVLSDWHAALTVEGPAFDVVEFWIRSWFPNESGTARLIGSVGLNQTYFLDVAFDSDWALVRFEGIHMNSLRIEHNQEIFIDDISFSTRTIPEPSTYLLIAVAVVGLVTFSRRRIG